MSTAATPRVPPRLTCPRCGATMNRHAEKVDLRTEPHPGGDYADLGGALCEIHTCPGCRYVMESAR